MPGAGHTPITVRRTIITDSGRKAEQVSKIPLILRQTKLFQHMGTVVKYDNIFQYNESSRPLPPLLRILRRFPQGREVRRFALRT